MEVKQQLFKQCQDFVNRRLQTVEEMISSNQKALQSETKSSAGDKHETGRAMLQLEMEKASQQFAAISKMKQILSKIDIKNNSEAAHLGSIIYTTSGNYFLSISAGQLTVNNVVYFAISVSSPMGKILLGKTSNSEYVFNKMNNKVLFIK